MGFVAAAGASRTYRRAYPAANGSSAIFAVCSGRCRRGVIPQDSIGRSLKSPGTAIRASRTPGGVTGSNPKSPRRPHTYTRQSLDV